MQAQSGLEMRNWEGSIVWHPARDIEHPPSSMNLPQADTSRHVRARKPYANGIQQAEW